jgi:hypothetical protein
MPPTVNSSATSSAPNKVILASRKSVDIHSTLTSFLLSHNDGKDLTDLYTPMAEHVTQHHHVIWIPQDVLSVCRAADKTASSIKTEQQRDDVTRQQYDALQKEMKEGSYTRSQQAKKKADNAWLYDKYKNIKQHEHGSLALAQLALHEALNKLRERSEKRMIEMEAEAERVKQLNRQAKQEEMKQNKKRKQEEKEEKAEQARKARADKEAKEEEGARARNARLAQSLASKKKDEYKLKKERAERAARVMILAERYLLDKTNTQRTTDEKKKENEAEEEEEAEGEENQMP